MRDITSNPYYRFFGEEDRLQAAACQFINLQYPNVLWCHVPNEGKRTKYEQFKALAFGIKAGVSDIMIYEPNRFYNGLCIELKAKKGTTTQNQKDFLKEIEKRGWKIAICRSIDEVIIMLESYFSISKREDIMTDELISMN